MYVSTFEVNEIEIGRHHITLITYLLLINRIFLALSFFGIEIKYTLEIGLFTWFRGFTEVNS